MLADGYRQRAREAREAREQVVSPAGHLAKTARYERQAAHRSVRVSDEDWGDLAAATDVSGSDRGTVIKQFIRWYLRRPGAELPARPAVTSWLTRKDRQE